MSEAKWHVAEALDEHGEPVAGKVTVPLAEAVEFVKQRQKNVSDEVRTILEQNRHMREARRSLPTLEVEKPGERSKEAEGDG